MKTILPLIGCLLGIVILSSSCKKEPGGAIVPVTEPIELDCDYFKQDRVLVYDSTRPFDYYINCVMEITANVQIEQGVRLVFGDDAGLHVTPDGSLYCFGGELDETAITMVHENSHTGGWKGILFESSSTKNNLNNVIIQHAGGGEFNSNGDRAAIIIWADAKLSMHKVVISFSDDYGVSAPYTGADWSMSNSQIFSCTDAPVHLMPSMLSSLDGSNSYPSNGNNYIHVELYTDDIRDNTLMANEGIPYRIFSTTNGFNVLRVELGQLTIEAGNTIEFMDGCGVSVGEDAAFKVDGGELESESVVFTGVNKVPNAWGNIYFEFSQNTQNIINNALIEYAGSSNNQFNIGSGILMHADPSVSISNVEFKDINNCATHSTGSALNPNLVQSGIVYTNTQGQDCHE